MGALSSYPERASNQLPARNVQLSYHIEVQTHEVTQEEFLAHSVLIHLSIMIAWIAQ